MHSKTKHIIYGRYSGMATSVTFIQNIPYSVQYWT